MRIEELHARKKIGISGWSYRKEIHTYAMFDYYAGDFAIVDMKNSFYRLPTYEQFEQWKMSTPLDCNFSVKARSKWSCEGSTVLCFFDNDQWLCSP